LTCSLPKYPLMSGLRSRVNLEAQSMLAREAGKVGVNFQLTTRTDARTGARTTEYVGDAQLHRLQQQVQQAGGNPLGGVADDLKAAAKDLREATAKLNRVDALQNQVPRPLPAAPPVMNR
jgi:hypothetical protein